jgi:ABC-type dipeptide/oligopeptide/nickel transport system permease component
MGLLEVLTLIFVTLKVLGVITWSWWVVLSPAILGIFLGMVVGICVAVIKNSKL